MNPMNQGANSSRIDARYTMMLIVWLAMLSTVGMFIVMLFVIERPTVDRGSGDTLFWVLLAIGISTTLLSFVLKSRMLAKSVKEQRVEMVQSAMILALALCEATSIFGLLAYFVTATPYYYILFIIGLAGGLLHFPRRDQLLAASYKG